MLISHVIVSGEPNLSFVLEVQRGSLADRGGGVPRTRALPRSTFIFMHFSAKIMPNNRFLT